MTDNAELLAARLCELYVRLRRRDHSYYSLTEDDEVAFRKFAPTLLSEGVDALHYLEWAFYFYRASHPIVPAGKIAAPKTLRIYRDKVPDVSQEISLEIALQIDTLRAQLAMGRDAWEIITDPYLELGSLFRYALARRAQLPELVARFKEDATLTLSLHPRYREFLSGFLSGTE